MPSDNNFDDVNPATRITTVKSNLCLTLRKPQRYHKFTDCTLYTILGTFYIHISNFYTYSAYMSTVCDVTYICEENLDLITFSIHKMYHLRNTTQKI